MKAVENDSQGYQAIKSNDIDLVYSKKVSAPTQKMPNLAGKISDDLCLT